MGTERGDWAQQVKDVASLNAVCMTYYRAPTVGIIIAVGLEDGARVIAADVEWQLPKIPCGSNWQRGQEQAMQVKRGSRPSGSKWHAGRTRMRGSCDQLLAATWLNPQDDNLPSRPTMHAFTHAPRARVARGIVHHGQVLLKDRGCVSRAAVGILVLSINVVDVIWNQPAWSESYMHACTGMVAASKVVSRTVPSMQNEAQRAYRGR